MLTCCGPSLKTSSATANILSCWLVWACTFTPVHNKRKPTLLIRLFGTGINTFAFFRCGLTTKPSTFEANQWLNDPSSIGTQTAHLACFQTSELLPTTLFFPASQWQFDIIIRPKTHRLKEIPYLFFGVRRWRVKELNHHRRTLMMPLKYNQWGLSHIAILSSS